MAAEMWPLTLDMTREECRGILRRSELETYSSVVSTFRAQGGLSATKARILQELREILHINPDRHKAEARRVANDERLCTIAEMISGPNTGQEWSKEGHRNFPMLSRSAPHTGLSVIANTAQTLASVANSLLPLPEQTQREVTHDHFPEANQPPVVLADPLDAIVRPPLIKRAHPNSEANTMSASSGPQKKRLTEVVPINHTNLRIQQLYHNHSKTPNPPLTPSAPTPRKNAAQKRTKSTPKPRVSKQKIQAQSNRTLKLSPAANIQPSQSSMAYASSLKSKNLSYPPENKSLHGETFPELPATWNPIYPPSSSQNDGIKFEQIVQQQPTFSSSDITPTSPVQVVFTSHVNLPVCEQPKYPSYPNNLITESTPIQWVEAPPAQPIIQAAPTILPPTATLTPLLNPSRPMKMIIPAATAPTTTVTKKHNAPTTTPRAQAPSKTTKSNRRKTSVEPPSQPTSQIKIPLQTSTPIISNLPQQTQPTPPPPPPLIPTIIDHNSLQISSITNKLPTMTNLNLISAATTKLPTQIMQTNTNPINIMPQKKPSMLTNTIVPTSSGVMLPSSISGGGTKPKIQVTQQIIMPSPSQSFQSKGNVKLVTTANGSIVLKGTDLIVPTSMPTSAVPVTLAPLSSGAAIVTSNTKTSYPKVQLVKKNNSNMIVMQKVVGHPFGGQTTGTAIKDGRPMKFNILQNKPVVPSATQQLIYDLGGKSSAHLTTTKPVLQQQHQPQTQQQLNVSNVQITEDTPVDILPSGDNMIIEVGASGTIGQPQSQPMIGSNHIIFDSNLKPIGGGHSVVAAATTSGGGVSPIISSTIQQQKLKPMKLTPVAGGAAAIVQNAATVDAIARSVVASVPPTTMVVSKFSGKNSSSEVGSSSSSTVLTTTDWEEALDQQHQSKQESVPHGVPVVLASASSMDEMIEEDGSGTDIMGGYVTSEETNDDDIIQYEGDSTDYQDEMSLDGVPDTTTNTPPDTISTIHNPVVVRTEPVAVKHSFPSISSTKGASQQSAMTMPKVVQQPQQHTVLSDGGSQDGDDEDTQDGDSMMMQMQEFDENGCSQIRNVSLEELVDSGHIILDDS